MKLFDINRPEQFFKVLDECKEPVYLTAVDGRKVRWQEYREQPALVKVESLPVVELRTSCPEDRMRLIRFAMENRAG